MSNFRMWRVAVGLGAPHRITSSRIFPRDSAEYALLATYVRPHSPGRPTPAVSERDLHVLARTIFRCQAASEQIWPSLESRTGVCITAF